MRIDVVTLFPEFFPGPLAVGLVGKAIAARRAEVGFIDPREFTSDRHRTVDDAPYGGGAGMVMKPEPMVAAIQEARRRGSGPVVLLTPQGRPIAQSLFVDWLAGGHLVLVAGRYEGFDERVRAAADLEVSLGDFVLTGGEYAALAIIDGVVRLVPGTVGNAGSTLRDSFSDGLLEHPQYTRPESFGGARVPEILLSGDHGRVDAWRRAASLARTRQRRPDLLARRSFDDEQRRILRGSGSCAPPVELLLVTSDVDWDRLARVVAAYGVARAAVVGASRESCVAWKQTAAARFDAPPPRRGSKRRADALTSDWIARRDAWTAAAAAIDVADDLDAVVQDALDRGRSVVGVRAAAGEPVLVHDLGAYKPLLAVFGADERSLPAWLPSLRVCSASPALPMLVAVGIVLDRLIGEG